MSTSTSTTTTVTIDTTCLETVEGIFISSTPSTNCVTPEPTQDIVAVKKEYSIVGDAFYVGVNSDVTPSWLTDLINSTVSTSVNNGLTKYDLLVQDVRGAVDSIDVAANTYVEQINFNSLVDGIVGTHLATLNTTYDGKFATIASLDIVKSDSTSALALSITDVKAEFSSDINSRITEVNLAFSNADQAIADSVTALTVAFTDQESNISATANAVSGLQTYVGVDPSTENPSGTGMLARIDVLEKQTDGTVDIVSNTYDVVTGVNDDNLVVDALPYVLWTNITGTGVPVATTRSYMDYSLITPAIAQVDLAQETLYTRDDFTDVDVDKHYKWSGAVWVSITEADFLVSEYSVRSSHMADVYIKYDSVAGARNYLKSYKFIRSEVDVSSPFSTDAGGYGWALVTDTDSQAVFTTALEALAMADGKISHFYAWADSAGGTAPINYDVTTEEAEYKIDPDGNYLTAGDVITTNPAQYVLLVAAVTETVVADFVAFWFNGGALYRKGTGWGDKVPVPTISGNGSFISDGDILTVFNPIDGDTATYWYNGTSWQINSPEGVSSKSKWFVDLNNDVYNPHGHVAKSVNEVSVTGKAYADEKSLSVENKFSYDSSIYLGGKYYKSGFGLDSSGVTQINDGLTEGTAFDSNFWVNAKRFVLKNPDFPGVEASFNVTNTGITLGLENTEATRNNPRGSHVASIAYDKGDVVSSSGSSFVALGDVPANTPITVTAYWSVLAEKGKSAYDVWIESPANAGKTEQEFLDHLNAGDGLDGNTWYATAGLPSSSLGVFGDFALRDGRYVYEKTSNSAWTYRSDLRGSDGAVGDTGIKGDTGNTGANGTNGSDGTNGTNGTNGSAGSRGVAVLSYSANLGTKSTSSATSSVASYWNSAASSQFDNEIAGDTLILTNTSSSFGWTHIYEFNGSSWVAANVFTVNGSQIVTGTIVAGHIQTGSVTADKLVYDSAYMTSNGSQISIASLTSAGSAKVFGNEWGGQTPYYTIPPQARLIMYGAFNVHGTSTSNSSVTFSGRIDTTGSLTITSGLSIGSAIGEASVLSSPQFTLTAYNNSTSSNASCRFRIDLGGTNIANRDSTMNYIYMILKR